MEGPREALGRSSRRWGLPLARVRALAPAHRPWGGSLTEAEAALAEIALELVAITDRLQQIHDELPPSRDREAVLDPAARDPEKPAGRDR